MTYGDIIEWIEENYDFESDEDPRAAFNTISEDWEADNRDTLANTLGKEAEPFIGRIQNLISQTDQASEEHIQRVDAIERGINELSERIGAQSENILTRVFNFFKGLFR